jgi:undecaprenyl-diphosphatase
VIPNVAGSSPVDRPLLSMHTMTTIEAILLGIIQGLTEFLPVSSSGHLELGQFFLGFSHLEGYVLFNLVCHLGTLLAICCIFMTEIKTALLYDKQQRMQLLLGTLPLFPLVFLLKPIKALFDQPQYLGYFFLITALLLYLGTKIDKLSFQQSQTASPQRLRRDALVIGLFQAIAILPGISRSGATISAGRMLGWEAQRAVRFSFLLAIPAILGGVVLETLQLFKAPSSLPSLNPLAYAAGFTTSFLVGYLALRLLIQLASRDKFIYFAWYCLFLGIATTLYFNFFLR